MSNELSSNLELDLAVARCLGLPVKSNPMGFSNGIQSGFWVWCDENPPSVCYQLIGHDFSPSTCWSQGGPIIESNAISISTSKGGWAATSGSIESVGDTPLVAAMRCFVLLVNSIKDELSPIA